MILLYIYRYKSFELKSNQRLFPSPELEDLTKLAGEISMISTGQWLFYINLSSCPFVIALFLFHHLCLFWIFFSQPVVYLFTPCMVAFYKQKFIIYWSIFYQLFLLRLMAFVTVEEAVRIAWCLLKVWFFSHLGLWSILN